MADGEGMMARLRQLPPVATPISINELLQCISWNGHGPNEVHYFEETCSKRFGARYSMALSSGRAALTVILRALKNMKGKNEVIIPAYTCPSIAASVVRAGLKVVLCDLAESGLAYDIDYLKALITDDTLVIVCVHLVGCFTEMSDILKTAKDKGVIVIEDMAQSAKTAVPDKIGIKGDIGFYSFGRGKNIALGGGGLIATDNKEYIEIFRRQIDLCRNEKRLLRGKWDNPLRGLLKNPILSLRLRGEAEAGSNLSLRLLQALCAFAMTMGKFIKLFLYSTFINPWFYFIPQHLPFLKLGETLYSTDFEIGTFATINARLAISVFPKLDALNRSRRGKALFYRTALAGTKNVSLIDDAAGDVYLRFPIFVNNEESRERIYEEARRDGLGVTKMYPVTLDKIEGLAPHLSKKRRYPNAEKISNSILTLPTHHWVREGDMVRITTIIKRHLGKIEIASPRFPPSHFVLRRTGAKLAMTTGRRAGLNLPYDSR